MAKVKAPKVLLLDYSAIRKAIKAWDKYPPYQMEKRGK